MEIEGCILDGCQLGRRNGGAGGVNVAQHPNDVLVEGDRAEVVGFVGRNDDVIDGSKLFLEIANVTRSALEFEGVGGNSGAESLLEVSEEEFETGCSHGRRFCTDRWFEARAKALICVGVGEWDGGGGGR